MSIAHGLAALATPVLLFRLRGLSPIVQALYEIAGDMAGVAELPWALATPDRPFTPAGIGPGRLIDMRDFAFDPAFRGVAMIDYFLRQLGLAPDAVASGDKRNLWLSARLTLPRENGPILLCPDASMALRRMPDPVHARIIAWAGRRQVPIVSQRTLPRAETLPELCALVASAQLLVSTDTAMIHLADAYSVPTLAFFTTHDPAWRVRDYPFCRAVHLRAAGLPPALEFARDDRDLAAAAAAWFAPGHDLVWLDDLLDSALRMASGSA